MFLFKFEFTAHIYLFTTCPKGIWTSSLEVNKGGGRDWDGGSDSGFRMGNTEHCETRRLPLLCSFCVEPIL